MSISAEILTNAKQAAALLDSDVYLYNGAIATGRDLPFAEAVYNNCCREKVTLFIATNGGDPDAAYKIARYLQEKYKEFTIVVAGKCKSAGTLIALGANEIAFTPYGELGPLDIQLAKVDRFDQMQSGLAIQDALNTLEERALDSFFKIVRDYIHSNRGMISFSVAAKAGSDFVTQLYGPIFARVDPEEVGARTRSMRIASDYGRRLSVKSQNLRPDTLRLLAETYSSHSFVIDQQEAEGLFVRVRSVTDNERNVVIALGKYARFQNSDVEIHTLHEPVKNDEKSTNRSNVNDSADAGRNKKANGGDSAGSIAAPDSSAAASNGRSGRAPKRSRGSNAQNSKNVEA